MFGVIDILEFKNKATAIPRDMFKVPAGPRFDARGMVLPHSILGSLEDFKRETALRGDTEVSQLKRHIVSNVFKKTQPLCVTSI